MSVTLALAITGSNYYSTCTGYGVVEWYRNNSNAIGFFVDKILGQQRIMHDCVCTGISPSLQCVLSCIP